MWFTTPTTQEQFQKDFDEFGDSFTEDTTIDQLKQILSDDNLMQNVPVRIRFAPQAVFC